MRMGNDDLRPIGELDPRASLEEQIDWHRRELWQLERLLEQKRECKADIQYQTLTSQNLGSWTK